MMAETKAEVEATPTSHTASSRPHLLLHLQKALQVRSVQMVLMVAVGQHEQVEVSASGHHLVEGAELLKT